MRVCAHVRAWLLLQHLSAGDNSGTCCCPHVLRSNKPFLLFVHASTFFQMIGGPTRDINWQSCKHVTWMLQMSHLRAYAPPTCACSAPESPTCCKHFWAVAGVAEGAALMSSRAHNDLDRDAFSSVLVCVHHYVSFTPKWRLSALIWVFFLEEQKISK